MSKFDGFNSVMLQKPKRSQFDLSHTKRTSTRAGRLTPVFITECIPGDTFNGSSEILVRMAPLLAPIYDFLTLYVHFFFVPNRLLWVDWEEFITGGRLGVGVDPVVAPVPPYINIRTALEELDTTFDESQLLDYLGFPQIKTLPGFTTAAYDTATLDTMPVYAYNLVWYEYYRDRNFIADSFMEFPQVSGENYFPIYFNVKDRCWSHDYFTSALPNTQRGLEVLMPIAGSGSVTYLDNSLVRNANDNVPPIAGMYGTADDFFSFGAGAPLPNPSGSVRITASNAGAPGTNLQIRNIDEVLLDSATTSINDFRSAYSLQVWLERNEVGGSRYNESTYAHFGVRPQDSRLQRPEYIGGGRIPIKVSEIVSTAYSDDGDGVVPLANLAGHGITYGNTNRFHYFCAEHGFIIGIASIMSPPSYHQGMPRMFRRKTFLDYPWPTFAKLGEQRVDKSELFASGANLTENADGDLPLFGYQSRYADWKTIINTSSGAFHSTLKFWTLVYEFASSPVLGSDFTDYDVTVQNRIFAVNGTADNFWLYVHNQVTVVRCLPYYGTPNTLGFS